jgi:hypothetical protein
MGALHMAGQQSLGRPLLITAGGGLVTSAQEGEFQVNELANAVPGCWYRARMEPQPLDEDSIVNRATDELRDQFADLDGRHVEETVRRVVHDSYVNARVKNYVGVIAQRRARDELQQLERN